MKSYKSQTVRLTEKFITAVVIIVSVMLVSSGIAIAKVNTEYMSTGVRAAKIVAERDNEEIFVSMNDRKFRAADKILYDRVDSVLSFAPAPINTGYFIFKEIYSVTAN